MPKLRTAVAKTADGVAAVNWRLYRAAPKTENEAKNALKRLRFADFATRTKQIKAFSDSKDVEEVTEHALLKVLDDPSDQLTGYDVWKLHSIWQDLIGDSFFVTEMRGDVPVGLWPVPPHWVTALPDYSKPKEERTYRISTRAAVYEVPAKLVIHLRDVDPTDPLGRGSGTAFSLGDELDTDEYAARFAKGMLFNNAVPGAIVAVKGISAGNNEALKAFKESLIAEYGGPDRAGRVQVVGGQEASVTVARLDSKLVDLQFVEMRKFLGDFIRTSYGIPPEIIGDMSSSNKAAAYAAREIFAEHVVQPRMEFLRRELQKRLVPLFGPDLHLEYDSPVPEDREFTLKVMQTSKESFQKNEVRRLAGHRPDPKLEGEYLAAAPGTKPNSQETPAAAPGSAAEAAQESKDEEPAR